MGVRSDQGKKTRDYYIVMEKIILEYVKYEKEYNKHREEYFAKGNSQAGAVITELQAKIHAQDQQISIANKNQQEQHNSIVNLRHQVDIRDKDIEIMKGQMKATQTEVATMCEIARRQEAIMNEIKSHQDTAAKLHKLEIEKLTRDIAEISRPWPILTANKQSTNKV